MSEINSRPTSLYVPDLAYPKPLAKLIANYKSAHESYVAAYTDVVVADAALTRAPSEDEADLITAAAAGEDHPGHRHQQAARAALAIAEENCRVARENATAQTDIVRSALLAATEQLVPLVLDNIRAAAASHAAALDECKAREQHSRSALQSAMGAMRMVAPHIATRYGVSVNWHGNAVAQPTWPMSPLALIRDKVEHLEQMITQADQAKAHASASA